MAKMMQPSNNFEQWCKNNNREDLLEEWNYSKNQMQPSDLGAYSKTKVWWIKAYDTDDGRHFDFEWEATVVSRVHMNSGCPHLSGKAVLKGFNDLETFYPEIAKEFHPTKNGSLHAYEVLKTSNKKYWWKCKNGHEWEASVYDRINRGIGCQICAGKKLLKGFNDLKTINPELAKEFHPTKNGELTPSDVLYNSSQKVWWLLPYDTDDGKHFDFEWKTSVRHRSIEKTGCPYLSGTKLMPGLNDFKTWCIENKLEKILSFWDYDKNRLTPSEIPSSSKKKYFWKCEKGHSWSATTDQLRRNRGCSICSGRAVKAGENDLEKLYPNIAIDWDFEKNKKKPSEFRPGSGVKVWWKCKEGHSAYSSIVARMQSKGCPYCSGMKIYPGYNDFKTLYPELALQWDKEHNKQDIPNDLACYSHKKFWWKCKEGHSWQTSTESRVIGNNCPICSKNSTSIPEQTVFYYLSKHFDCINRDRSIGAELDIYIPSIKTAIEYDGCRYHGDEQSSIRDQRKNELCRENGIKLYRIREDGCYAMNECENVKILCYKYRNNASLEKCLSKLFKMLNVECDIDLERDRFNILELYYKSDDDKALDIVRPDLAKEWHPTKNGNLTPSKILYGTQQKVWWICKNGHEFYRSPNERRTTYGCPYCSKTRLNSGINDLMTNYPEVCEEWDYEKNTISPYEVSKRSHEKVWWKGKCGHNWQAAVNSRTKGIGCPYCSGLLAIKGVTDLATTSPEALEEWDYDKNTVLPTEVKKGSEVEVWWKCSKCGHSYKKKIGPKLIQKYSCPNCNPSKIKKIMNIDTGEVFDNLVEASAKYNIHKSSICNCCKGKLNRAGGYHWKYVE